MEQATRNVTIRTIGTHVKFNTTAEYRCKAGFVVDSGDTERMCIDINRRGGEALMCVAEPPKDSLTTLKSGRRGSDVCGRAA